MSLLSWLRTWKRSDLSQRRRAHAVSRQRAGFQPQLEALEERTLLSTYYAATTSDLIADIKHANSTGGTNTIVLTAPTSSPYVLTTVNNSTNGANGLPQIAKKDSLTIVGNGDTIERSTASGTPAFRLFDVASGGSLTLENVTLQGGLAFGSGAAADGGAIYNQGTLTLIGATMQGNTAQGSNGSAVVDTKKNIYVPQAGAVAEGGGIWSSGMVKLEAGTTIGGAQANEALGGQGSPEEYVGEGAGVGGAGFGGGLYEAGGSVTMSHSTLVSNQAVGGTGGDARPVTFGGTTGNGGGGFGGGLYEAGGSVTMSHSTLVSNQALGGMGGYKDGRSENTGNGGAASGGGLFAASGTLAMSNDTVEYNTAKGGDGGNGGSSGAFGTGGTGSGGGVYVGGGMVTLQADQLLSNAAQGGDGGLYQPTGGVTTDYFEFFRGLGGSGLGGGLYVGGGTVTLTGDTVTGNAASAGVSGDLGVRTGSPGVAGGGGIFIVSQIGGSVYLNSFTVANTTANYDYVDHNPYHPPQLIGEDDIDGPYTPS
jgi:hypothetical protein